MHHTVLTVVRSHSQVSALRWRIYIRRSHRILTVMPPPHQRKFLARAAMTLPSASREVLILRPSSVIFLASSALLRDVQLSASVHPIPYTLQPRGGSAGGSSRLVMLTCRW